MKRQTEKLTKRERRERREQRAEWAKLPKYTQHDPEAKFDDESNIITTTGFDEQSADLAQLGIDPASFHAVKPRKQLAMLRARGVTKDEVNAWIANYHKPTARKRHRQLEELQKQQQQAEADLRERGLTQVQAVIVYAKDTRKLSFRKIGIEIGTPKSTIANEYRRAKTKLRTGTIIATPSKAKGLPGLLAELREILDSERTAAWEYDEKWGDFRLRSQVDGTVCSTHGIPCCEICGGSQVYGTIVCSTPDDFWQKVVSCLRSYPATLTHGKGLNWPAKLAEILAASKYGSRNVRKKAREALSLLTEGKPGNNPVEYGVLAVLISFGVLYKKLVALQRIYKTTRDTDTAARLAALRKAHPGELDTYDNDELRQLLKRDPLAVAVELAATASNTSADFWRDLFYYQPRKCPAKVSADDNARDCWERAELLRREKLKSHWQIIKRAISGKDPC